jgi:hypothetical protein
MTTPAPTDQPETLRERWAGMSIEEIARDPIGQRTIDELGLAAVEAFRETALAAERAKTEEGKAA